VSGPDVSGGQKIKNIAIEIDEDETLKPERSKY
jgi:hypothetical protein